MLVPHFPVDPQGQPLIFQPVLPTGIRNRGVYAHACRYCPSTLQSEGHLWLHEGRHWGVQHCSRCNVYFTTRAEYDNHTARHSFSRERYLIEHSGHHWGVFCCFSCDQYFASDASYRRHRQAQHRVRRRAAMPDLEEEEPFRARSENSGIAF
jgi:hypothetical protein